MPLALLFYWIDLLVVVSRWASVFQRFIDGCTSDLFIPLASLNRTRTGAIHSVPLRPYHPGESMNLPSNANRQFFFSHVVDVQCLIDNLCLAPGFISYYLLVLYLAVCCLVPTHCITCCMPTVIHVLLILVSKAYHITITADSKYICAN